MTGDHKHFSTNRYDRRSPVIAYYRCFRYVRGYIRCIGVYSYVYLGNQRIDMTGDHKIRFVIACQTYLSKMNLLRPFVIYVLYWRYVQPIADMVAQNLEMIFKTFSTNQNSAHGIYETHTHNVLAHTHTHTHKHPPTHTHTHTHTHTQAHPRSQE